MKEWNRHDLLDLLSRAPNDACEVLEKTKYLMKSATGPPPLDSPRNPDRRHSIWRQEAEMWATFGLKRNVAPIRTICGFRTCSTLRVRVWETGVPPPARSTGGALEMARGWSDNPAALFRAEGTTPPRAWLARRGGQGGCTPAEQREWRRSGRGSAAPPGRGRRAPGAAVRSPARWAVQAGAESGRRGLRTLRLHVACGSVGLGLRAADLPFGGAGRGTPG